MMFDEDLERGMLLRKNEISKSNSINYYEASMLIALDDDLFREVEDYKFQNTPLTENAQNKIVNILQRVEPIDKNFYRGVETRNYDDDHIMKIQSWSTNKNTAGYFGRYIFRTTEPSRGVSMGDIFYFYGLINGGSNGMGDSQSEWFLLNPDKESLKESFDQFIDRLETTIINKH